MKFVYRLAALAAVVLLLGMAAAAYATVRSPANDGAASSNASTVAPLSSTTDNTIASLQRQLKATNNDPERLAALGFAYLQKVRETGDPSYYAKAETVLKQAHAIDADNAEALRGLGSLALARHDFAGGVDFGEQAAVLQPDSAANYGVIGDGLIELGRYDEALAAFQKMIDLKPDLSAYARAAYARELMGDFDGAVDAMQLAVEAGGPNGENAAWVRLQLGNLYFNHGDYDRAEVQYNSSLGAFPGYVHALAALAKVQAARGDYAGAAVAYQHVVDRYPVLEYVIALGNVQHAAGRDQDAAKTYDLVSVIEQLYTANGVNSDLELALYLADHDQRIDRALAQAQAEYDRRPSIHAADVLSWVLYKSGRYDEALPRSNEAQRLGTQDAAMFYHAAMIRQTVGDNAGAREYLSRAIGLNPQFSVLYASAAQDTLDQLDAAASR